MPSWEKCTAVTEDPATSINTRHDNEDSRFMQHWDLATPRTQEVAQPSEIQLHF